MQLSKISWWKWLATALLLYALVVGLSVKTGPGIASLNPSKVQTDADFVVNIQGYNTQFAGDDNRVWIKLGEHLYCAESVQVASENLLKATFKSFHWTGKDAMAATLVVENPRDGMFLDVKGLRLMQSEQGRTPSCESKPEKLDPTYFSFPFRTTLFETVRNLNYHVPMWFTMIILLLVACIYSILYLNKGDVKYDHAAHAFSTVGLIFGLMGVATGAFWAKHTWGVYWTADPKLNGAAIGILIYMAYHILRSAMDDEDKKARIAAVYNILAYPLFIVLIIVLPKLANFSLHPGSGDSVGFDQYDLNSNLRKVFYPAVLGWILLGTWIATIKRRYLQLEQRKNQV
jgi:heme exporter protein C